MDGHLGTAAHSDCMMNRERVLERERGGGQPERKRDGAVRLLSNSQ